MRRALLVVVEALFKVLFTYECHGEENVPASGPAVVAANHPSYLDPVLLSLGAPRPIRFMAWDALFRVPLLGAAIRALGAFPVDIRKGQGRGGFETAKALVESGEAVGIFPEGRRSRTGWMEPSLREGAARLALATGAPLVPATIAGAFRAWPQYQSLPKPARVRVRFHEPIDPATFRGQPEEEAVAAMLGELRRRVDRSLLPGVKADRRMEELYRQRAPWPRAYEYGPLLLLAVLAFWRTRRLAVVAPAYLYIGYLLLDHALLPQGRLAKWVRNASAPLLLMVLVQRWLPIFGLPPVPAGEALLAITAGALFPYLYEHGGVALDFIRGLTIAVALGVGALFLAPVGAGAHVLVCTYAAAYAWQGSTVFWRWAVLALLAYAAGAVAAMGFSPGLVAHALAGLVAWMVAWLLPYHRSRPSAPAEPERPGGLGLFE